MAATFDTYASSCSGKASREDEAALFVIREIARRTGLDRNRVKKYLRSDQTEPQYAKRASSSKLDPYADKLTQWLETEVTR